MSTWVSAITNPQNKITRKVTNFSGSHLNIYPWPVASRVQRLSFDGSFVLTTGPVLGTTVGAIEFSGSPTLQADSRYAQSVTFNPVRINVVGNHNGQFNNVDGEYIVNPSGFSYLRVNFGKSIGPINVFVEGYESFNDNPNLNDFVRTTRVPFNRLLTGNASAISSYIKKASPPAFRASSKSETAAVTLTGNTHLYLSSTAKFSGMQVNLSSENYLRTLAYTIEYWNGSAFTALTTTASTVGAWSDSDIVFHQSGIITWTAPNDWAATSIAGDPYMSSNSSGTNLAFSKELYYVRIVPPTPNAESVGISSISLFT